MTLPTALPRFRDPSFRDLAKAAQAQGWDVYQRKGGHVSAVNPRNGAHVVMSATARGSEAHSLANARQALIRGGLVLDRGSKRRRPQSSGGPMQAQPIDTPPTVLGTREVQSHGPRNAGGRFAWAGPQEVLEVQGVEVRLGARADGTWVAYATDPDMARGVRQWYSSKGRDVLLERLEADLVERPIGSGVAKKAQGRPLAQVEAPQEEAPQEEAPLEEVRAAVEGGPLRGFHVVQADPEEYPLAAALDRLEAAIGPALAGLEAAGKSDAAALLRSETARTPVEEELLALYRRVMNGD